MRFLRYALIKRRHCLGVALLALLLLSHSFEAALAAVKVIPVPAFSTTKNEGETYGQLTAFLFADDEGKIYAIMAPFVVYNDIMGVKSAWQFFGYLEGDRDFILKASYSTKINREFRMEYKDPGFLGHRFAIEGGVHYLKEATARFYGLGQESREIDETNFTERELIGRLQFGLHLSKTLNLSLTERFRETEVQLGGIKELPYIGGLFPDLDGLGGATIWGHRLSLTHERRDDRTTPTEGEFFRIFAEWAHVFRNGGAMPFSRLGFEAKTWIPHHNKHLIFVPNIQMQWVLGSKVPFFERSVLGGEDTLRGYGLGRFVDDNLILLNLEARIRVAELTLFGVRTEEEIAPFVDVGRVYSTLRSRFFDNWEINPGVGMRVLVRPNVVGRLDVAFGREGPTFFVGLNFPF